MSRKISAGGASLKNNGVSDVTLSLGTWRTPNADRPVLALVTVRITPTGTTSAEMHLEVDRGGGTAADDTRQLTVPAGLGGDFESTITGWIPPGGSYRLVNVSDPNSNNAIIELNEITL